MKDKKDKSERLEYLNQEKLKQEKRKLFYKNQIEELKDLIKSNEDEIKYNNKWIEFHENSINKHKETIKETLILDEKIDQEEKIKFHINQIKEHHEKDIEFHKKEVDFYGKRDWAF